MLIGGKAMSVSSTSSGISPFLLPSVSFQTSSILDTVTLRSRRRRRGGGGSSGRRGRIHRASRRPPSAWFPPVANVSFLGRRPPGSLFRFTRPGDILSYCHPARRALFEPRLGPRSRASLQLGRLGHLRRPSFLQTIVNRRIIGVYSH